MRVHRLLKALIYRGLLHDLPGPFEHVRGHCWKVSLPKFARLPATSAPSRLVLFEDQQYLGPSDSPLDYIEQIGRGWYRHAGDSLFFSTPDNTDPNENQRTYSYATSRWLHRRQSGAPNNTLRRDPDTEALHTEVEYALAARKFLTAASEIGLANLHDRSVLDLGPGFACASSVLLACSGAHVRVVDPYPAVWQPEYHTAFYTLLRDRLAGDPQFDLSPIDKLLKDQAFTDRVMTRHSCPVELLDVENDAIDIVFSNAVVEHFYDVRAAFSQLYRVTRPGGWGIHWVDFRDHRDFSRPLEYLLLSEPAFQREFGLRRGELGNRLRPYEFRHMIEALGFEVAQFTPSHIADTDYLVEFTNRLRHADGSPYQECDEQQLATLSCRVVLRKPIAQP